MSNVVKMAAKKKKPDPTEWKEQIETLGDKLTDRVYDAIRLADEEAKDDDIPDEIADCVILGAISSVLVHITAMRNIIGPEALVKLIEYQIHGPHDE